MIGFRFNQLTSIPIKRKKQSFQKAPLDRGIPLKEKSPPLMSSRQHKTMREFRSPTSAQLPKSHPFEKPKLIYKPSVPKCIIQPPSWAKVDAFQGPEHTIKRAAFKLKPHKVNFGSVLEGRTYLRRVFIQNLGVTSSRYKVKQPPERTGIRVFYNSVPVGPGMTSKMDVELHAILSSSMFGSPFGVLTYDLEILTDIESLHLPIEAKIVSEQIGET